MSTAKATFPSVTNNLKRNKMVKLLAAVVTATLANAAAPYGFLSEADADALLAANTSLVEVNKTIKNEKGEVAVHATTAGVSASQAIAAETPATTAAPAEKLDFVIETAVPLPAIKRGGAGATKYPFEKLELNASFFVPGKSIASTVNSANKRYKDATPKRKFAIRAAEKDGVKGSRIWRIE